MLASRNRLTLAQLWDLSRANLMRCPTLAELAPPPTGKTGWPWTVDSPQQSDASDWPRISIVTPSFNQGQFLEETIRSVLLQGYPNLEYIVIDGGSADRSVEIIEKYAPWLASWVSEPDCGQSDAINKGFAICTGDILGYINSDDLYAAGALQKVARAWIQAGRPEDVLIIGQTQDISETGKRLPSIFKPSGIGSVKKWLAWGFPKTISWGEGLYQPGCMWTAATWQRFGPFPKDFKYIFDRYFLTKIAAQGLSSVICLQQVIAFFRWQALSKTATQSKLFHEEWRIAVTRLRSHLSLRHRLWLRYLIWQERSWDLVSKVMSESDPKIARDSLVRRLVRTPTFIFSRPVLGAARRLLFQKEPSRH